MKQSILHSIALVAVLAAGTVVRAQNTNATAGTNATPASTVSTKTGSTSAKESTPASADSGTPRMNLTSFQIIENRNIFDPNRRPPRVVRDNTPRDVVEYFGLNGAMTYENQAYAFFDGSGQVRNRAYKPADKINGYTISAITNNTVKLAGGSNQVINLTIGMQLRRVNNGPWTVVASSVPPPDTSSSSSESSSDGSGGSTSTLSGPEADVMARLMKRRAEEMKDQSAGSTGSTAEGTGTNEIH
jgi:hypothetical protein